MKGRSHTFYEERLGHAHGQDGLAEVRHAAGHGHASNGRQRRWWCWRYAAGVTIAGGSGAAVGGGAQMLEAAARIVADTVQLVWA